MYDIVHKEMRVIQDLRSFVNPDDGWTHVGGIRIVWALAFLDFVQNSGMQIPQSTDTIQGKVEKWDAFYLDFNGTRLTVQSDYVASVFDEHNRPLWVHPNFAFV